MPVPVASPRAGKRRPRPPPPRARAAAQYPEARQWTTASGPGQDEGARQYARARRAAGFGGRCQTLRLRWWHRRGRRSRRHGGGGAGRVGRRARHGRRPRARPATARERRRGRGGGTTPHGRPAPAASDARVPGGATAPRRRTTAPRPPPDGVRPPGRRHARRTGARIPWRNCAERRISPARRGRRARAGQTATSGTEARETTPLSHDELSQLPHQTALVPQSDG